MQSQNSVIKQVEDLFMELLVTKNRAIRNCGYAEQIELQASYKK